MDFYVLRFILNIEKLGWKLVKMFCVWGLFFVLYLCYEMDMLLFLGCVEGCIKEEVEEFISLRFVLFLIFLFYIL